MSVDPNNIFAIIVGVENYEDKDLHPLPAAAANAFVLNKLFVNKLAIPASNIYRTIDPRTNVDVLEEIEQKLDPEQYKWDLVIFYYAGHGIKSDDQKDFYLSMKNTRTAKPYTTGIHLQQLVEKYLDKSPLVMILDCCFSGKAFDSAQSKYDYIYIASSAYNKTSKYPVAQDHSAFTESFIEVLEKGLNSPEQLLCLEEVFESTRQKTLDRGFPDPLRLSKGNLGNLRFLPNQYKHKDAAPDTDGQTVESHVSEAELLFRALRRYDPQIREDKQSLDQRATTFPGELNRLVLDRYPYPVAYFLKSILAGHDDTQDPAFYRHMYGQVISFLAFLLMEDLVENKHDQTVGKLSTFDLSNIQLHDCLNLLRIGCGRFSGQLFVTGFEAGAPFLSSAEALEKALQKGAKAAELRKLAICFVSDLAFLANYLLLAVREVSVQKGYCPPNRYRHENSRLIGESLQNYKRDIVMDDNCLHNGTILLFHKGSGGKPVLDKGYLNLWPLCVDANGLKDSNKPNIYLVTQVQAQQEFIYEAISLKRKEMEQKPYTDINEFISDEDKQKYFDAFLKRLLQFFD